MSPRIIRKLGGYENGYLTTPIGRRFACSTRLSSKLDLFADLDILNRAIHQWMSTQPLLQARVASIDGENNFVYDERLESTSLDEESDLQNVKYLTFDLAKFSEAGDKSALFDDVAGLLRIVELNTEFNNFNELLWRLLVLEMPAGSDQETKEYYFTLVLSHSISEGRNTHMLMLQLFDLIEHNFTSDEAVGPTSSKLREYPLQPSIEDMYLNGFDPTGYSDARNRNLPFVLWPAYVDPEEASGCQARAHAWESQLSEAWILRLKRQAEPSKMIQLKELADRAKASNIKFTRHSFTREQTSRLIDKCKQEGCTVTHAITNLFVFALRKLDASICEHKKSEPIRQYNVSTAVTMRQFEPTLRGFQVPKEFTDQLTMGQYATVTNYAQEQPMSMNPSALEGLAEFWTSCRSDHEQLRAIIREKAMFFPPDLTKVAQPKETQSVVFISSLGLIPAKLPDAYALSRRTCFSIEKTYMQPFIGERVPDISEPLKVFLSTCNGVGNLSIMYFPNATTEAHFEKVLESFFTLFNRLLE